MSALEPGEREKHQASRKNRLLNQTSRLAGDIFFFFLLNLKDIQSLESCHHNKFICKEQTGCADAACRHENYTYCCLHLPHLEIGNILLGVKHRDPMCCSVTLSIFCIDLRNIVAD